MMSFACCASGVFGTHQSAYLSGPMLDHSGDSISQLRHHPQLSGFSNALTLAALLEVAMLTTEDLSRQLSWVSCPPHYAFFEEEHPS